MDIYCLVAANLPVRRHPPSMDARAEDHYYASQRDPPRLNLRVIGSIAATAGIFLLVAMI